MDPTFQVFDVADGRDGPSYVRRCLFTPDPTSTIHVDDFVGQQMFVVVHPLRELRKGSSFWIKCPFKVSNGIFFGVATIDQYCLVVLLVVFVVVVVVVVALLLLLELQ